MKNKASTLTNLFLFSIPILWVIESYLKFLALADTDLKKIRTYFGWLVLVYAIVGAVFLPTMWGISICIVEKHFAANIGLKEGVDCSYLRWMLVRKCVFCKSALTGNLIYSEQSTLGRFSGRLAIRGKFDSHFDC